MDSIAGPFADGLRIGCLVEVWEAPAHSAHESLVGEIGQLISFNAESEQWKVAFLNNQTVNLEKKVLKPGAVQKPGEGGGKTSFDIVLGPTTSDEILAEEVATCIFEKGFCVIRMPHDSEALLETLEEVNDMAEGGRLGRLASEVEEGYLGVGGKGKVFWLDGKSFVDDSLVSIDHTLSHLASLIQPFSADCTGKVIEERTPALVSLTLHDDEEEKFPHPPADDKTLGNFLSTWRRGAVRCAAFLGPGTADVALERREENAQNLPRPIDRIEFDAVPGVVLLFRPDCFTYHVENTHCTEVLSLTVNFLESAPQFYITHVEGDPRALRGTTDVVHKEPEGDAISIMSHCTRLPLRWDDGDMMMSGLQAGADAVVQIPVTRFDVETYWCSDPNELLNGPPRTVQKHMSYVDGLDLFDHRYFDVSRNEAISMDPLQRQVLEVGGKLLQSHGISKKESSRNSRHAGCAVGVDKDDFATLPEAPPGGCNAYAIIANRFSFVFNMKGPNYVCDTACSASLTATHVAKLMLLENRSGIDALEFHLALGTHLCLSPGPWIGCSWSQMVSPEGRSFTFNSSANGYLRGEGTSGILLKLLSGVSDAPREGVLRGSALGQDGKSASLTAPNGPSQEEMIWRAIREARASPPETTAWECHGTGTSLGDPIEVGAVRRVQIKGGRESVVEPLMLSTAKANIGHLEGGAAMGGIVRCLREVLRCQCFPSNHLRQLNPHLEGHAFNAFYATEVAAFKHEWGQGQVSSFGFGGSNGHAVIWGERQLVSTGMPLETARVLRRLAMMKPAEVRPIGDDPNDWESDLPGVGTKAGEQWVIRFTADDPADAPIRWEKDYCAPVESGDSESATYSIVGNFSDWNAEDMDITDGGHFVATAAVPASGSLEFRFLKDGTPDQVICPESAGCLRKTAPIYGPGSELSHSWCIPGEPGQRFRIELSCFGGRYAVLWLRV